VSLHFPVLEAYYRTVYISLEHPVSMTVDPCPRSFLECAQPLWLEARPHTKLFSDAINH
jgi:hypothetical protein